MILRPEAVVLDGVLTRGLQVELDGDVPHFSPWHGATEPWVLSPAFVNAHSHLEYRGLQRAIDADDYWPWIRRLTELKMSQTEAEVRRDCLLAAQENVASGVGYLVEHSDRPFAAPAMSETSLSGFIFLELITLMEHAAPDEKRRQVESRRPADFPCALAPHAPYTVDPTTLKSFAAGDPFSIHVAETEYENEFFRFGLGPIAEFYHRFGIPFSATGRSVVEILHEWGLVRAGAQFVHVCAVSPSDLELLAAGGVTVAHCPRSNLALGCPRSPVRAMLDQGIEVGLGLDSAASSGPVDFFAEMREAYSVGNLAAEEVWQMATRPWMGQGAGWLALTASGARKTEDLLSLSPSQVRWAQRPSAGSQTRSA